jgi:uncharacterized membrane protein
MCTVLLPPAVNPIAVNKYTSYNIKDDNTIENCYSTFTKLNSRLYSSSSSSSSGGGGAGSGNNN